MIPKSCFVGSAMNVTPLACRSPQKCRIPSTRKVSPVWRPHLLAVAVHVLQGPRMEDSPAFLQAQEELSRVR
jgi:hypothetical protein